MSLRALLLLAVAACSTRTPNEQTRQDPVVTDAVIDSETCGPPAPLAACETPVAGTKVTAHQIARVTGQAVLVTSPPNDPRLFVIEKNGRIRIIEDGVLQLTPFIDLSSQLVVSSEQGLLGLAFHPNYNCNGEFFVYYTTSNANVVARCTVSDSNPNLADPTCTTVISIPDFAPNHNGGMIEFGADGYLYIGTGDGGQYGDPRRNAQALWDGSPFGNTVAWLGKILRIDVDHPAPGSQYGIPADNPYAAGGGKPEIFISGVRNPWRWSFDRATGDMWIGDVGQNQTEELNVLKAGEQAGKNLGWSVYEGNTCCKTQWDKCSQVATQPCDATDKT
ncbi:MAG: sorbosone dehydrogenase family protein, partial [Kofleriaceae bacterium]